MDWFRRVDAANITMKWECLSSVEGPNTHNWYRSSLFEYNSPDKRDEMKCVTDPTHAHISAALAVVGADGEVVDVIPPPILPGAHLLADDTMLRLP